MLVSYAGRKEGNYGYIYQATSWTYLGYFISSGFWLIDGRERHQLTLWHTYKHDCDITLPFKEALCQKFTDVRQTWTKQFIYVKLLDKKLHYASEPQCYPKGTNEYPICTKEEVYKSGEITEVTTSKEPPIYYHKEEKRLFTIRTLKRNNQYVYKLFGVYSKDDGRYFGAFNSIKEVMQVFGLKSESAIRNSLKTGKPVGDYLFQQFNSDEAPEEVELKYICIIDGKKFYSLQSAADHCGTVRQSIYEARKRHAKKICGHAVEWHN